MIRGGDPLKRKTREILRIISVLLFIGCETAITNEVKVYCKKPSITRIKIFYLFFHTITPKYDLEAAKGIETHTWYSELVLIIWIHSVILS